VKSVLEGILKRLGQFVTVGSGVGVVGVGVGTVGIVVWVAGGAGFKETPMSNLEASTF